MSQTLAAPEGFSAVEKDCAVFLKWNAVFGAEGYKVYLYSPYEPTKCIKMRYAQKAQKTISGLENGRHYIAEVRAFYLKNGVEVTGEPSHRISFLPVCTTLKSEGTICMNTGESAQIQTECADPNVTLSYISENADIAVVDPSGVVTAKKKGVTGIKISSSDGKTARTEIVVKRTSKNYSQKAVLMFTGEIMCTPSMQKKSEGYDFTHSFDNIRSTLAKADFSAGVLDQICCDEVPYEHEQKSLSSLQIKSNAPSSFIYAAAGAGFSGLITSTDNALAYGELGLDRTVETIRKSGMMNFGTCGNNLAVIDVKGFKIGLIACSMFEIGSDYNEISDKAGKYSRNLFTELINTARADGAEFIIAYMHWGMTNSHQIRRYQREEARFIANSGADLIIGSHTHTVQRLRYIETDDGRRVPCAYSLGSFLTSLSELSEQRDGLILRVEIYRDIKKTSAKLSYIPIYSESRDFGVSVERALPVHSENTDNSFKRTKKYIGSEIKFYIEKPSVMLVGSLILYRIFTSGNGFKIDKSALYLSPLSLGAEKMHKLTDDMQGSLALDVSKDLTGYITENNPDFVAVDFYTAATISIFKHENNGDCYYSNTKAMRNSEFYKEHRDHWLRIRAPFGENVWKPLVKNFAKRLLAATQSEKIILFRCNISSRRFKGLQLRTSEDNSRLNRLLCEMEDYFIKIVNPSVVDISDKYFVEEGSSIKFENDYYVNAYNAAEEIAAGKGRTCENSYDAEIWFSRAMRYYESMTERSYHKRLLDMDNAADKLVAYTSVDFCARNCERIIRLKKAGKSDLIFVKDFFANDKGAEELVQAAEIINLVEKGNLTKPYDFYRPAFEGNYNIVKKIAHQLSRETGASVDEKNAELVFLLRGKAQMRQYFSNLCDLTIDVWGSSVSREAVNHCREARIGSYIYMQPAIFALERPIEFEIPVDAEQFCDSRWRRNVISDAFKRKGIETLENSAGQWIIVDFYDLICTMAEFHGDLFEIDDFLRRTDFFKKNKKDIVECYLFEKRDMKYCFEGITKFSNEILDIYGENIILVKTEPKNRYITSDYELAEMPDPMYDIKKKFISLCEERFAGITKCYVIDISKNFYSSDAFPYGGKNITNYEDEFYRQAAEFIKDILKGTDRKVFTETDRNYMTLRDLKLKRNK